MISETTFTPWPPPAGEPIGLELARRIIAWAKVQAPPLIAEAGHMLISRHPGASDVHTSAWPLKQLAEQKVMPAGVLTLGVVSASVSSGAFAMVDVVIRPDGYLELRPGMGMHDRSGYDIGQAPRAESEGLHEHQGSLKLDHALYTIGYQGKSIESFVRELVDSAIEVLVDVRRVPLSRKPGFSKSRLRDELEKSGIRYIHFSTLGMPKELMPERNLTDNSRILSEYKSQLHIHLNEIDTVKRLVETKRTCLLCFEAEPHLCHRSVLATELIERGIPNEVTHL